MGTIETVWKSYSSDERSVIADKGEIGFIDYEDDKSVCNYDPIAEGPIVISIPFPFVKGKPQSVFKGQTAVDCITIQNTTSEPIDLWKVKIYSSNPEDSYTLSLMEPPSANSDVEAVQGFLESFSLDDRVLQPRKTLKVWLSCKPQDIGIHTTAVHFDVGDDRIERVVFLLAEDQISQSIAPNKPYARVQRKNRYNVTDYVPGSRPAAKATTQMFKYRLPMYQLPKDKREMLERRELPEEIANGLNSENYGAFFSILLMMEELKLEEEMKSHDLECVPMTRKGHLFLALEVPGLAERRPSLVHGDFVFATPATENHDTRSYQGYIHRVEADEVFLKFSTDLHKCHCDGDLYNIRFTYNRVNMRRLYQAIQAAAQSLEIDFLFPSQSPIRRIIVAPIVTPLNPCLNEEQKLCVKMILGCKGGPPYVIHGPPGTGKTMTLVETILQLYTTRNNARILVCASSNSAADHILEKLIAMEVAQIKKKEIFRLNATSRPYEDVNPDHIQFCYFEDFIFRCPPTKALKRYKIIISTYMSSSLLYAEGIKRGHFSHVFLDEAGQASEPETMIPISNICSRQTVVVLAGDPMQLGPVIYSRDAESYGLGKSFLERLFECEFYHTEDANFVVKLVKNYRCHQAILELPSELFYKGELIACKEKSNSCSEAWENLLPNKEFPVLFVGIQGCDEREGNNPSWFNRIEVSKVVEIVKKLMSESDMLTETDIGVITPYRQQVLKMKKIFEDQLDMPNIKVGSVEQFQGQERRVIIISTVRSTVKHNQFDRTHYLGFLSNPRRYNVALTRAGDLLIIVGNPHIICKDPYWNKLLWYAVDNNSYQGCPMPEREDYPEEGVGEERNLNFEGHWHNQQPWQEPGLDHGSDGRQQSYQGGEWDSGKQSYQGGEWDSGQQSYQGGEWDCPEQSNQAGGEWDCPEQSNQAGGEWDCPQQSNQAGGEWECPQQSNQAGGEWECPQQSNHAGEWADPQQSKHAGWVDPQASKYAGWSREQKKHGDWDEPKHKTRGEWQGGNWQPTKWIEPERSNWGTNCFSDLPKPVTDEAEWSDGWK